MISVMDAYLFPTLFCLVLCAAFVWLAGKRMRAGKPHRVFVWLARFFGVMVVMGVDSICKAEGIILGGLVVVAGAVIVLMIVSGIIRELGARKKGSTSPSQSEVTEAPKKEMVKAPVQEQEDEEREEGPALSLPIQNHSPLKRRGAFSVVGCFVLGVCIGLLAPLWFLIHQQNQTKMRKATVYSRIYSLTRDNERLQAEVKYLKDSTQEDLRKMDRAVQEALKGRQVDAVVTFPSKLSTDEYERKIAICLDLLRDWDTDDLARKRVEARWGKGFIERVQKASPEDRDEILGTRLAMILGDDDAEAGFREYKTRNRLWDQNIVSDAAIWRHFQRTYSEK